MRQPIYIVDVIGDIVSQVETAVLPKLQVVDPSIQGVFYEFGHPAEIVETLMQKDKSQTLRVKKYPAVILFQDFDENIGSKIGIYATSPLRIAIVHHTRPELKSKERYDRNFKPVLYPIYLEFMEQLKLSARFIFDTDEIRHTKSDKPYYNASKQENAANDFVDAIEITDLTLNIYLKNC